MSSKINSYYIIINILDYFPFIKKLQIIKYSKQYQKLFDISILDYKSFFYYNLKGTLYANRNSFLIFWYYKEISNHHKELYEIYNNEDSEISNYISAIKILKKDNYLNLSDNNFDEIYKYLQPGYSIKLQIDENIDFKLLEERIKKLFQKNISINEIIYNTNFYKNKKINLLSENILDKLFKNIQNTKINILDNDTYPICEMNKYNLKDKDIFKFNNDYINSYQLELNEYNLFNIKYLNFELKNDLIREEEEEIEEEIEEDEVGQDAMQYKEINDNIGRGRGRGRRYNENDEDRKTKTNIILREKFFMGIESCAYGTFDISNVNFMSLKNLINLNITIKESDYTYPRKLYTSYEYELPNLKEISCINIFPNFYNLKSIENIKIIIDIFETKLDDKIINSQKFEKEFPFIISFFSYELNPSYYKNKITLNYLFGDFEENKIHTNLKHVYLKYNVYFSQACQGSPSYNYNRIYKRNFEKNKLKISECNIDNLYQNKLKIPHKISDNFSSIKIVEFNCKQYEQAILCSDYDDIVIPFKKIDFFVLKIEEDPVNSKLKIIYFPFLPYKYVLEDSIIKIKSYEELEQIWLYIYNFKFIKCKLFDKNNIQLSNLKKIHLHFGRIPIDIFKPKILNFIEKISDKIEGLNIFINNTDEYCCNIKDYIFSLPFVEKNEKIKNKIFIYKVKDINKNEIGKFEFNSNVEESQFEEYKNDDDY